ncbi:hypothetical protein BDQ17DRAFT_1402417 [Cyathus striatus]|nr:hypothetical protein BDQ17DRAFT_1402417 [Cyathus striatus]
MTSMLFGDLLTLERIRSLQESRSVETTAWRRLQLIIAIIGMFHTKGCRDDQNSLLSHVNEIQPRETSKIESKPGFRRMHEVIQHVGIASRLECWRVEAAKRGYPTLESFAESKPSWEILEQMANKLVVEQVGNGLALQKMRTQDPRMRDQVRENLLMRQQHFLLYEEMSYTLNQGDIGHMESCFLPWMFIFQGCGKHKYAAEFRRYIENVHFRYPKGLRYAIRMNILCNPTGKKGHFRAIDWVVEHNNLYIKRIYGGKYSNHTKTRILRESAFIEVFKNIRIQFEQMFCLKHKTTRHSPPNMKATFSKLQRFLQKNKTCVSVPGRKSKCCLPDVMMKDTLADDNMPPPHTHEPPSQVQRPTQQRWTGEEDTSPGVEEIDGEDL